MGTDEKTIPNPAFLANGHGGFSPKSRKYFTSRAFKGLGGSAVSLAGGLGSGVTAVDVGGILREGNAVGSTALHLVGIKAAGKGFKKSETVTRWVDAMLKAKAAKITLRGTVLAGAAIPIPAVGLATGIATTVAKGLTTMNEVVETVAAVADATTLPLIRPGRRRLPGQEHHVGRNPDAVVLPR